ncbi:MAG: hypothetical protein ACXVB0_00890 [Mucilaginibacter sp.]
MNRKRAYSAFYYFIGTNKGTWMLILVHVMILISLIVLFSSIIARMQNF